MVLISRDRAVDWAQDDDLSREALCRKFPLPRFGADPWFDDPSAAMAVCNGDSGGPVCPMRNRCLRRALINNESWGVWGGLMLHDRKMIKNAHPDEPEKWTWQPPTAPTPRRRRRKRARARSGSPSYSATEKPPASYSPTSAPTSLTPPASPIPDATPTSCTPATSAVLVGALTLPFAVCEAA